MGEEKLEMCIMKMEKKIGENEEKKGREYREEAKQRSGRKIGW